MRIESNFARPTVDAESLAFPLEALGHRTFTVLGSKSNEIEGEPQLEQKDIINYVNSFHSTSEQQQNFQFKLFCPFSGRLIDCFYHFANAV